MWRELVEQALADAELGPPADEEPLTALVNALGQPLPPQLTALLRECDGVRGRHGLEVVWSAERIAETNAEFRASPDFAELYMPFEPLMFFGDNGGGDQFAFVRTPERGEVFVWADGDWYR